MRRSSPAWDWPRRNPSTLWSRGIHFSLGAADRDWAARHRLSVSAGEEDHPQVVGEDLPAVDGAAEAPVDGLEVVEIGAVEGRPAAEEDHQAVAVDLRVVAAEAQAVHPGDKLMAAARLPRKRRDHRRAARRPRRFTPGPRV